MTGPCRPAARERFLAEIVDLDAPGALFRAATAVAMHALPDVEPDAEERRVEEIAEQIRARTPGATTASLLAHLHQVVFEEMKFAGATEGYHDPRLSYVPVVLEERVGLPILLALVYREVAVRVGLDVTGLNTPGHFLVSVLDAGAPMIVDPFDGGRVLSREDTFVRIERSTGLRVMRTDSPFPEATPRAWLSRILQNLVITHRQLGQDGDAQAMTELQGRLRP